jgi:hypothetical protein
MEVEGWFWRVVAVPLIPVVPVVHDPNPRSHRARQRRVSRIWLEHGAYLELRLHLDHRKRGPKLRVIPWLLAVGSSHQIRGTRR